MTSLFSLVRRHWVALVFAAAIGFVSVGPYAYFETTPDYHGVVLLGQDAEDYYIARIQEVYEGHLLIGNAYTPYKNVPYLVPSLGEDSVAFLGKIFFATAAQINIYSKFIFPFCAFLLAYGLVLEMSGSRAAALLGATLAMLGTDFMSYPGDVLQILRGRSFQDGIYWARPINPEISGVWMFGTACLIYRQYIQRRAAHGWEHIAIGLLFGASLYISPYTWSFLGVLLFLLFLYYVWRREFLLAREAFVSGTLGALCAIPFILNAIHARSYPGYTLAALQNDLVTSHAPVFGIWVFVLLLVPIFLWPKKDKGSRLFFIASAAALLFVLNQQVLTGIYLQPGHFHWYITKPLIGLMLGIYGVYIVERFISIRTVRLFGYGAVVGILICGAVLAQMHFYTTHAPATRDAQTYAPLLSYLRRLESKQVVFADTTLSPYISIYTQDDAPNTVYTGIYINPPGYLQERLFLNYKLRGILPQQALSVMQAQPSAVSTMLYGPWVQISQDQLSALAQAYAASYATPISSMMRDLGITMLAADEQNDAWKPDSGLVRVARIEERFGIYEIASTSAY